MSLFLDREKEFRFFGRCVKIFQKFIFQKYLRLYCHLENPCVRFFFVVDVTRENYRNSKNYS